MDATEKAKWLLSNINILLSHVGDLASCRGCGKAIFWVRHKNGKRAPYTPEGLNHFADCPQAKDFKS